MTERYGFDCVSLKPTAIALVVAAAVTASPFVAASAQAQDQHAAFQAYAHSRYGYCDAKKVADVWHTDVGGGKVVIGNKIKQRLIDLVDADIAGASGVRCSW